MGSKKVNGKEVNWCK